MAEDMDKGKAQDADPGGQQGDGAKERTFTQTELDAAISERLRRERDKYADYTTLKAQAEKWAEYEAAQKSEAEKMAEKVKQLEAERDKALSTANMRLLQAAFVAEAAQAGAMHPKDAYALAVADGLQVSVDDKGDVVGVAEAVKALLEAGRLPLKGKLQAPGLDGGAGGGKRAADSEPDLTTEEMETALKMGLSPEDYAKSKKALKELRR